MPYFCATSKMLDRRTTRASGQNENLQLHATFSPNPNLKLSINKLKSGKHLNHF
jgi:hypothetical protein